jgi:ABC-type sugar transport system substrate-binding protein
MRGWIAFENSRAIQPLIKAGDVSMTTNASISDMGFKAVETTARYLKGEKVQAFVEVKPYIVDKSNVDSVVPEL